MVRRQKLWAGVVALLIPVAMTSCSSSHKAAASRSSRPTPDPIKVGLICDCSGAVGAILLPEAEVYEAWVKHVNSTGGINGHQIKLTVKDDNSTPGVSVAAAQSLIADHVDAIADDSVYDEAWASSVQAANIPVVGEDATETPMYSNPDFYPEGQTNDSSVFAMIATAKAAGVKDLAAFYCAEAPSCMNLLGPLKSEGAKAGVPVRRTDVIALTDPNYTAQCVAAQEAHIPAVAVFDAAPPIARVGEDCNRQGYDPVYLTEGEGAYPVLYTAAGIKNDLWSEFNDMPYWAKTPSIQTMNAVVDQYYPGLRSNPNDWNEGAAEGWPSGLLLEDAVKAGGLTPEQTPSAAEVVKGLQSLKGDTLQGWGPPLTFAAGKPHSIDCWFTAHTIKGVSSLANGGRVTCAHGSSS